MQIGILYLPMVFLSIILDHINRCTLPPPSSFLQTTTNAIFQLHFPLTVSARFRSGHERVVRRLLEYGADVDKQDTEGRTALMAAAFMDHAQIVRILLENGASPNVNIFVFVCVKISTMGALISLIVGHIMFKTEGWINYGGIHQPGRISNLLCCISVHRQTCFSSGVVD